jgi:hypothetical protein
MARQAVEKVTCDRCKKEELQASSEKAKTEPDFLGAFKGEKLVYTDLCTRCKGTMDRLWEDMKQWDRQVNPLEVIGPSLTNGHAAPVQSAPNYSPPQPHSNAAAKK